MLLAAAAFTIIFAFRRSDWRNWQRYHDTLIYISMSNLLYNFVYDDKKLWQYMPDHFASDLLVTLVILPLTGLIFLTNYPDSFTAQAVKILKYVSVYFAVEALFWFIGVIEYDNGWHIWLSLPWNIVMFPLWALHHKKPLLAYAASCVLLIVMEIVFPSGHSLSGLISLRSILVSAL